MKPEDWAGRGRLLLEASAGTGKTYTLVRLVARLLTLGTPLSRVVVVTFTRKAAEELRSRLRDHLEDRLAEARQAGDPASVRLWETALQDFPQAFLGTVHSFCQEALARNPFEAGLPLALELSEDPGRRLEFLKDWYRKQPQDGPLWAELVGEGSFDDAIGLLDQGLRKAWDEGRLEPSTEALEALELWRADFDAGRGALRQALEAARPLLADPDWALRLAFCKTSPREYLQEHAPALAAVGSFDQWLEVLSRPSTQKRSYQGTLLQWAGPEAETLLYKKAQPSPDWALLTALAEAWRPGAEALKAPFESAPLARLSLLKQVRALKRLLPRLRADRNRDLQASGQLGFDDLILWTRQLCTQPEGQVFLESQRRRWSAVLIDEFQDTDADQWTIFDRIFPEPSHTLVVIGDPKQSIYRFRGADLAVYQKVASQLGPARTARLEVNYRSDPQLTAGLNRLFALSLSRPESPFRPAGSPPEHPVRLEGVPAPILWLEPEPPADRPSGPRDWYRAVGALLARLKGQLYTGPKPEDPRNTRPLGWGDMALLVKSNREAAELETLLTEAGIPALRSGRGDLFHSPAAELLDAWLRGLEDPSPGTWTAILRSPLVQAPWEQIAHWQESGWGPLQAEARRLAALAEGDLFAAWESFLNWPQIAPLWENGPWIPETARWDEALIDQPGGLRTLLNLEHLLDLLLAERHERLEPWTELLGRRRRAGPEEEGQDLRLWREGRTVRILTHHSSKGLQFPVTVWMGAWHESPLRSNKGRAGREIPLEIRENEGWLRHFAPQTEDRSRAKAQVWEEALRVWYVSLTRAEGLLVLPFMPGLPESKALYDYYAPLGGTPSSPAFWDQAAQTLGGWPEHAHLYEGDLDRVIPEASLGPPAGPVGPVQARAVPQVVRRTRYSRVSFSSLQHAPGPKDPDKQSRSADERALPPEPPRVEDPQAVPAAEALPAGPEFGDQVHQLLARADFAAFAAWSPEQRLSWVSAQGRPWGWKDPTRQAVCAWCTAALTLPLPGLNLRLADLAAADQFTEWEVLLPARALPDLDREAGAEDLFTGVIDLAFRSPDGALHLLDYKTNRLPGYEEADLQAAMEAHAYPRQARLYAQALDRWRRPGAPEGRVYYLFLRGLDPESPGQGVWHRPWKEILS